MSNIVRLIVVLSLALLGALGANEMHTQEKSCHDFYPAIESPLQNSAAGAALAFH